MTDSKNSTPPKSSESKNSNSSVHIETTPKSQKFEFVPRDTEESEFLEFVNFGDAAYVQWKVSNVIIHTNWREIMCMCTGMFSGNCQNCQNCQITEHVSTEDTVETVKYHPLELA